MDEAKGAIYFASEEDGSGETGGDGSSGGSGGGQQEDDGDQGDEDKVARYGCDPRSSWSPWR